MGGKQDQNEVYGEAGVGAQDPAREGRPAPGTGGWAGTRERSRGESWSPRGGPREQLIEGDRVGVLGGGWGAGAGSHC